MLNILKKYNGQVHFLEGNPLDPKHLYRAKADTAYCVVVLSSKYCTDPILEDYRNILQSFGVKLYAKSKAI